MAPPVAGPARRASRWTIWVQLLALAAVVIVDAAVIDREHQRRAADLQVAPGAPVAVTRPATRYAAPTAVDIPRLHVRSALVDLRRRPDGTLQTPSRPDTAGWYVNSAHPGDRGPTVLVGHVDSDTGPGIFYALRRLRPGDVVLVARADRTTARFVVRSVEQVPKRRFPTARVYTGRTPSLRLITCGGSFDRSSGHYRSNVIVYADPAPAPRRGPTAPRRPAARIPL